MLMTTQTADAPRRGKTHPPSKNRVWDFFEATHSCTQENWQITQCSRLENQPTPTTTASGVPYYGYRYYNPELGRWINRDLIGEKGFELDRKPHATRSEQPQKGKCDRGGACGTGLLRDLEQSDKGISISVIPKDASLAYAFVFNNSIVGYDPYGLDCPGCDAVGGLPGMGSDCALRCCAKHDACYHDKGCTAASWGWIAGKLALCQIFGIPWYSCPLGYPVTNCDQCNIDVVKCLAGCLAGKDPGGPKYYCAKQGKYISIPGDFPDLNAAKNCCCN